MSNNERESGGISQTILRWILKNKTIDSVYTTNICGLSSRSKLTLEKYVADQHINVLALQETKKSLSNNGILSMKCYTDSNNGANGGCMLSFFNGTKVEPLKEISMLSTTIDTTWCLCSITGGTLTIATVYAKLNYSNAVSEILALIDSASKVAKERKAGGIILMGDFNARHLHWGDKASNKYGSQLFDNLDFSTFSIISSGGPTFFLQMDKAA